MAAPTAEELLEAARVVLESRGFRVTQASEAEAAELVAAKERGEATEANVSEDTAIAAFKDLASAYTKE